MITYTTNPSEIQSHQLIGFFEGWSNPPSPETHLRVLGNSSHVVLALTPVREVVGFVSALSDGVLTAYVSLLEVRPSHRRQGIGRQLVQRLLRQLGPLYSINLHCDPALRPFYESVGMRVLGGMAIRDYATQAGRRAT